MQLSIKPGKEEFFAQNLASETLEEEFNSDDLFELNYSTQDEEDDDLGSHFDPSHFRV